MSRGFNISAVLSLIEILHRRSLTLYEIAEECGIMYDTARRWIRSLQRRKLVYVDYWTKSGHNWVGHYSFGYMKTGEVKPKKLSVAAVSRNYRIRQRKVNEHQQSNRYLSR